MAKEINDMVDIYSCEICGERFNLLESLNVHLSNHSYESTKYEATLSQKDESIDSSEKIQDFNSSPSKIKQEDDLSTSSHFDLKNIQESEFMEESRNNKNALTHNLNINKKKRYVCETCGKPCFKKSKLRLHRRTHTKEKMFECKVCLKTFSGERYLQEHSLTHKERKRHICATCGKKCRSDNGLKRHSVIHTEEKHHSCETCSRSFTNKHHLDLHVLTHSNQVPHICIVCETPFPTKSKLKRHLRTHAYIKPFVCDSCGKAFSKNRFLKKHQLIHMKRETLSMQYLQQSLF